MDALGQGSADTDLVGDDLEAIEIVNGQRGTAGASGRFRWGGSVGRGTLALPEDAFGMQGQALAVAQAIGNVVR